MTREVELRRAVELEFRACERQLWGLAYRLTGTVADADDVVQETFVRAMTHPPSDTILPWFPWLVRVATNAGRDVLRRRRRRSYDGPWLPAPIETVDEPAVTDSPETRYSVVETATFAFLVAAEALSPTARAVLVLRDVFDLSAGETAGALELSEANVRTIHHRARVAMQGYDRDRGPASVATLRAAQQVFARLMIALRDRDLAAVRSVLAEDVESVTDANGEFIAATRPVCGRERVSRFLLGLAGLETGIERTRIAVVNGGPAVLLVFSDARRANDAPRAVLRGEVRGGEVRALHWILASKKLAHLTF